MSEVCSKCGQKLPELVDAYNCEFCLVYKWRPLPKEVSRFLKSHLKGPVNFRLKNSTGRMEIYRLEKVKTDC